MNLRRKFNESDLQRIKDAVENAESKISGEIVPVFVERSGVYAIASYRAAIVFAILAFILIIIGNRYTSKFAISDPLVLFVVVMSIGFLGGIVAHFSDTIKRWLLTQLHFDKATRLKAESYFLQEEVFNTRQRTGIMIFVSFFEQEVIVMADKGISQMVEQKEWDKMVQTLIEKIKSGKTLEGLEGCIKRCGEILLEKGFYVSQEDTNELKDDLRFE